ncbi:tricarballylate utilization 4Fe-4S protein TcuB [Monashia sp. NPDC004114]
MTVLDQSGPGGRTSLHLLVGEATRQLTVCNSCRYCEGYCAVFPALGRRTVIEQGDVSQLANLCHDCRACYDACMYSSPHEFAVDLPKALSAVRVHDYRRYMWPTAVPRLFSGWTGVFSGVVLATAIVTLAALLHAGPSGLVATGDGAQSPYALIPYPVLLLLILVPTLYSTAVAMAAGRRFWTEVAGDGREMRVGHVSRAVWYAATLRYLRGGGQDCYYPQDTEPSSKRRVLHGFVSYGFGLCLVSTTSAAILQDVLHSPPPYPWLSVPVLTGTVGGLSMVIGCTALLVLKTRASTVTSYAQMTVKDYGLLVALEFLALSGLAVLLLRTTPAFGIAFLVHFAAVVLTFAVAPYSKLSHAIFRFLAIVRDNVERSGRT